VTNAARHRFRIGQDTLEGSQVILLPKAPSPLRSAGAVHNGRREGPVLVSVCHCLREGVVESARRGMNDAKQCSHIGGTSSTSPTSIVGGDDLPARNERVGLSELVPPSFWSLSGIWILGLGISRATARRFPCGRRDRGNARFSSWVFGFLSLMTRRDTRLSFCGQVGTRR
jgi:hypothetical protein